MTHWLYWWFWASGGVGNWTAGVVAGVVATVVVKKLRLHEKARDWFHQPMHDRFDRLHERIEELESKER